jgi:hypothetical protein
MLNLLRYLIDNFFGAWTDSEYFARVVGYFLIFFTIIVFGFNLLSMWAGVSPMMVAPMWRVFWASFVVTVAFLYLVEPRV